MILYVILFGVCDAGDETVRIVNGKFLIVPPLLTTVVAITLVGMTDAARTQSAWNVVNVARGTGTY